MSLFRGSAKPPRVEEAGFEDRMTEALGALRELAKHSGLIAPCKALTPTIEELSARFEVFGPGYALASVIIIASPGAHPIARQAAGMILECFWPDWRTEADREFVGMVVERNDAEVAQWRQTVLERDGFACCECAATDKLHVHHVVPWIDAPALRVVVSIGRTLCASCHADAHRKAQPNAA